MRFSYRGVDESGSIARGKIDASTIQEAKSKLKAKNILYEKIREDRGALFEWTSFSIKYKINPKELANLSRELAMYVRSGMTIVNALKVVQSHYEQNRKMTRFLQSVATHVNEGKTLYAALEAQSIVTLPDFFKQTIKVSESSGILDEVLLELSRFLKEQEKLVKEIKSAFAYPAFMLGVALLMVGFMLTFVVPQITQMFEDLNQELPPTTLFVIGAGEFFSDHYMLLLIVLVATLTLLAMLHKQSATFRVAAHALLLKIPLLGKFMLKSELARFSYMGSMLIKSGVPFVQAVSLSANTLNNEAIKRLFVKASIGVVEGKRFSAALSKEGFKYDRAFVQALALGEETSQIEPVLTNLSELYFEENRDAMRLFLSLLEPVLMLFVGGSIGFIVTAMLLPVFSMSIA